MAEEIRSVAIIGGGPAGLTAGLYLARSRVDAVMLEREMPGGQAVYSPLIENYPGFPEGIDGTELADRMKAQAERFELEIRNFAHVDKITDGGKAKTIELEESAIEAYSVIVASGRSARKLGIPGEKEYMGRGVSYCATCDGPLFKERPVMVIGGGDAAIEEGLYLAKFASKVIVVHRRDELRASQYLQERALSNPKMEFLWNSVITEVQGDQTVESALVKNKITNDQKEIPVSGVFFYVGNDPNVGFVSDLVELDDARYVVTDDKLETSIPGIFAAGDVRSNRFKQVVVAAGEGALAAASAERYLESIGAKKAYSGGH